MSWIKVRVFRSENYRFLADFCKGIYPTVKLFIYAHLFYALRTHTCVTGSSAIHDYARD